MNDVALWRLLQQAEPPADPLAQLLVEARALDVDERWPFLAGALRVTRHAPAPVRAAAARFVAGASGASTFRALVALLDDPETSVREAAVEALAASASGDAARWSHALFHRDASVRRAALSRRELSYGSAPALWLTADPENRDLALALLPRMRWDKDMLSPLLEARRAGYVDDPTTCACVAHILRSGVDSHFYRWCSDDAAAAILAAGSPDLVQAGTPETPAHLIQVLEAGWGQDAAPLDQLHDVAVRFQRGKKHGPPALDPGAPVRLAAALVAVAARHRTIPPWAMEPLARLYPLSLTFQWLPRPIRRGAAGAIAESGNRQPHIAGEVALDLLKCDLVYRDDGTRDVLVVSAIALMASATPVEWLVKKLGEDAVVDAVLADPLAAVALLRQAGTGPQGAPWLIDRLEERSQGSPRSLDYMTLILALATPGRLKLFLAFSGDELLRFFVHILATPAAAELLSARTIPMIAGQMARTFTDDLPLAFLRAWLDLPAPEKNLLGMRTLGELARRPAPPDFPAMAAALAPAQLCALLFAIDQCSGFPAATDVLLAEALRLHADPHVAHWAATRLAWSGGAPPPEAPALAGIRALSPEEAHRIGTCSDAELASALAPALGSPVRGVVAALATRAAPVPSPAAATALIGCHDAIEDVALQLRAHARTDRPWVEALNDSVVRAFLHTRPSSLATHAWLACWEEHAFALAREHMEDADGVGRLLDTASALAYPPLGDAIWLAVRHVLASWRWREPERYRAVLAPEVVARLAAALPGRRENTAAAVLGVMHGAGLLALLEPVREQITSVLPDVSPHARAHIAAWLDTRGLVSGPPVRRAALVRGDGDLARTLARCSDLDTLTAHCCEPDARIVTEASLRLAEMGEVGVARLAGLLARPAPVPAASVIAETIALWPAGAALRAVRATARTGELDPQLRFLIALVIVERGDLDMVEDALAAACAPGDVGWFGSDDLQRLQAVVPAAIVHRGLAASPHPRAYTPAVQALLAVREPAPADVAAVVEFLERGPLRLVSLRLSAAGWLTRRDAEAGAHLRLAEVFRGSSQNPSHQRLFADEPERAAEAVACALADSERTVAKVVDALEVPGVDHARTTAALELLAVESTEGGVRARALALLARHTRRSRAATKVAEAFGWGVLRGRELTGKMFSIEMLHEEHDTAWTVPGNQTLHVNPLPLLRDLPHGREIVEGLVLHELGHQMYHAGPEADAVRDEATREGLRGLLNLVCDEHLERNLASRASAFRERFRVLAAWAFQHARAEAVWGNVLTSLGMRAFAALTRSPPGVARRSGRVVVGSGHLRELERAGSSFARFMRALRLGLGGRHGDPHVDRALALFKKGFRELTMPGLLDLTRRLAALFPDEIELLLTFGQHEITAGDPAEIDAETEGLSPGQLAEEIERVVNPRRKRAAGRGTDAAGGAGKGGRRWINVGEREAVNTIHRVIPLRYDGAAHRALAARVQRPARAFRTFLQNLGRRALSEPHRARGRTIDRPGLTRALIRRDPRILVGRRVQDETDLFIGVAVDCSGSMTHGDNIQRARLFGALLAEAARGVPNVDVRLFGFTADTIYDAGDAHHPAVHALYADGGNDDAAALLHVAREAQASRRRARLIVMISDGLPTGCSVETLRTLVATLTRRHGLALAQVAVRELEEQCFPHHVVVDSEDLEASVRTFGAIVARLVRGAVKRAG